MLDFKEISKDGTEFELLIREGLEVHWEGVGPDNGKDLVAIEMAKGVIGDFERKWVIQCKDFANSGKTVGTNEIIDVKGTCDMVGATAYLLVGSTHATSSLIKKFKET